MGGALATLQTSSTINSGTPQDMLHPTFILCTVIFAIATSATPPKVGFYPINLCPYGPSNMSTSSNTSTGTAAFLAANANAKTWAGTSATTCPQLLAPTSQTIVVNSFSGAQQNAVPEMPRSKLYSLTIFRSSTVASTHIDFAIRDALGSVVVPRMQLTLQPRPGLVSELVIGSRREAIDSASDATTTTTEAIPPTAERKKGKRVMLHSPLADSDDAFERPVGPRRAVKGGRRKGKGGGFTTGGIGGGGRYGGGSGGFRQAGASSAGKTYGYNSRALNSRYATYSRTPYGYSGRSVYYGGYPMFMYMGGFHHGRHYQGCGSYHGSSAARCRQQYSACQPVNSTCEVRARTELYRDDIMEAAVDASKAMFPLYVEFYSATVAWQQGAATEGWEMPLSFGFSEVDLDEEDDAALSWIAFMFILIIPCCCLLIFGWLCCVAIAKKVRARRATAARETSVTMQRQDSKELDIEAAVLPAYPVPAAVGTPIEAKALGEDGRVHAWKEESSASPHVVAEYIQPAPA